MSGLRLILCALALLLGGLAVSSDAQVTLQRGWSRLPGSAVIGEGLTSPLLLFGGTTSSFPALKRSSNQIHVRLADDSGYAPVVTSVMEATSQLVLNSKVLASATAPTISSGFGTSPSVTAHNGTVAFRVNVGTGGTANSGVIGLPAASTGWNCACTDITTKTATVFLCKQTASTTTTATVGNYDAAGAAAAWVASDVLAVSCAAY
jgi:hypothetical protein